jgi:hypothetical protein
MDLSGQGIDVKLKERKKERNEAQICHVRGLPKTVVKKAKFVMFLD